MNDRPPMAPSRRRFLRFASSAGLAAPLAGLGAATAAAGQSSLPTLPPLKPQETALAFAGDLFLTHAFPEHLEPGTQQVFDCMRTAGVSFANLENGLSTGGSVEAGGYRWGPALRGHPSFVKELGRAGVGVVSTANNHMGNFGRDAVLETLATLDAAGVRHAGAGRTVDDAFRPVHVAAEGVKIAFFSLYSCHYNRVSQELATSSSPGVACARAYDVLLEVPGNFEERNVPPNIFELRVNPTVSVMAPLREDVQRLSEAIRKGRADADLAILYVHFHWARHTKPGLPYHQRVIAHAAIDAGIDIFVGHGPHTLRGVELYRNKPVLFSIGNFVLQRQSGTARSSSETPQGHQSVVVRAVTAGKRVTRLEFLPIAIGHDGQPQFAQGQEATRILHRVSALSTEFGLDLTPRGWYSTLEIETRAAATAGSIDEVDDPR